MNKRDAFLLASRALALYLICWALSDVTYMPQTILSLRHHSSVLTSQDYFWTYYRVEATFRLTRIVALFIAAAWLMKAGPSVERFLMPEKLAKSKGTAEN